MSTWIIICCTMFLLQEMCRGSVDLNMAELQHVADHLNKRECRRLIAALRSSSRDLPSKSQLELVERQVPQADHCIDLLLRWNSGSGQNGARGRSGVEPLSRRLRQLGHPHLASWLSKSVFQALAQDLENDVSALNNDGSTGVMAAAQASPNRIRHIRTETSEEVSDEVQWMPLDTILCAAVVVLAMTALMLLAFSTWRYCCVRSEANSENRYSVLEDTEEESADTNVWNPTAEETHHPKTPHRSGASHPMYRYNVLQDAEEESADANEWDPIAEEGHDRRTPHRPEASHLIKYSAVQDTEEESEDANVSNPTAEDVHHLKTPHGSGTIHPMYYVEKETEEESTDVNVWDPMAKEIQHTAGHTGRVCKQQCVKSLCRRGASCHVSKQN